MHIIVNVKNTLQTCFHYNATNTYILDYCLRSCKFIISSLCLCGSLSKERGMIIISFINVVENLFHILESIPQLLTLDETLCLFNTFFVLSVSCSKVKKNASLTNSKYFWDKISFKSVSGFILRNNIIYYTIISDFSEIHISNPAN